MNALAIALSIPVFFALIGLEVLVARAKGRRVYRFFDSIASLDCGVVQQALGVFMKGFVLGVYFWIEDRFGVFEIASDSLLAFAALMLLVDHQYYWFHRASHRVNVLWATHAVHHQSEEYNLSTALRQGAVQALGSAMFYWPLALLGFPPLMFIAASTANTLYQFWIHTRLIGKLPRPIELVLNTPSHHRVHHAVDPEYIDKNYAGILIVWDRLYGTFIEEGAEPNYGVVKPLESFSPIWAQLEPFVKLARISARTARVRDRLAIWFAPPEWLPEDHGGPVTIPAVEREARTLYTVAPSPALTAYIALHFALLGGATSWLLLSQETASLPVLAAVAAFIVASAASFGALSERRTWAPLLELARLAAAPLLVSWIAPPWVAIATAILCVISAGVTLRQRRPSASLSQRGSAERVAG